MTKFPRLTLATLLMGSLALPAFALDTTSAKDMSATSNPVSNSVPAKPDHAMKIAQAAARPPALKHGALKSETHKTAATGDAPAKDAKAKTTAKDSSMKAQTTAPVTKTN